MLRVRSGLSAGLLVNASSKPEGGRSPVPNEACRRVPVPAAYAAESLGFTREIWFSGKGGREYPSPGIGGVRKNSARTPPLRNRRPATS